VVKANSTPARQPHVAFMTGNKRFLKVKGCNQHPSVFVVLTSHGFYYIDDFMLSSSIHQIRHNTPCAQPGGHRHPHLHTPHRSQWDAFHHPCEPCRHDQTHRDGLDQWQFDVMVHHFDGDGLANFAGNPMPSIAPVGHCAGVAVCGQGALSFS
jgi:hypothetical protein